MSCPAFFKSYAAAMPPNPAPMIAILIDSPNQIWSAGACSCPYRQQAVGLQRISLFLNSLLHIRRKVFEFTPILPDDVNHRQVLQPAHFTMWILSKLFEDFHCFIVCTVSLGIFHCQLSEVYFPLLAELFLMYKSLADLCHMFADAGNGSFQFVAGKRLDQIFLHADGHGAAQRSCILLCGDDDAARIRMVVRNQLI